MGLQIYQCEDHFEEVKLVPCTCRSRFCPSCGYKTNLIWLNNLLERVLPCDHQHLVFSLPYELRELARYNRRIIFRLMSKTISRIVKQFLKKHKALNHSPGVVAILHTFGKGLKWHVHFHIFITAGGISFSDNKTWSDNTYLNEHYLKKTWKAKMLAGIRKLYRKGLLVNATGRHPNQTFLQMLTNFHEKNWHVWINKVNGDSAFSFVYVGRYAKRAGISQKGILSYQRHKLVVWKEHTNPPTPNHCAYSASPNKFIDLLIQHIPNRYDHQVFYYSLYSSYHKNKTYKKARRFLGKRLEKKNLTTTISSKIKITFRKLMRWIYDINPLDCSICGKEMRLVGIIFFNPGIPKEKNLLLNYEVRNYELVKK